MGKIGRLLETCRLSFRNLFLPLRSVDPQSELSSPAASIEDGTKIGDVVAEGGGRLEWRIPEFSTLPRRMGAFFLSPDFHADSSSWCMKIYPNGSSGSTCIEIKLIRTSSWEGRSIRCTVVLNRADHSEETVGSETWGCRLYSSYIFDRTRRELEEGGWHTDGQLIFNLLFQETHATKATRKVTSYGNQMDVLDSKMSELSSPAVQCGARIGDVVAKGGGRWEWAIPEFSTLPRWTDAHFRSPEFYAEGDRWLMKIVPNGDTRIHITLWRTSRNGKYNSCTVGVKRAGHPGETIGTETYDEYFCPAYILNRTRRELEEGGWLLHGRQLTVTLLFAEAHASSRTNMQRLVHLMSFRKVPADTFHAVLSSYCIHSLLGSETVR